MPKLITLTTDFGLTDSYVGVMRGVILSIARDAQIIDITHGISPQQILEGAYVLASSVPYFPKDAVHVCVIDPGVGAARRAIAVAVGETMFVGPDNGVLAFAIAATESANGAHARVVELTNSKYWLPRVSTTFHGRDIFAPVAAHLAQGVPFASLGAPLDEYLSLPRPAPERRPDGALVGHITYIDRFGNLVTDIEQHDLAAFDPASLQFRIGSQIVRGRSNTYADAERGSLLALISSGWQLEIAQRDGSAAQTLNARVGDSVIVSD